MPLWAWHRPTPFLIAWITIIALNTIQNHSSQAFTTFNTTQEHTRDLSLHALPEKEKLTTVDDEISPTEGTTAGTSGETTNEATTGTKNGLETTEKDAVENYSGQTRFGTKIRTAEPQVDENQTKKENVLSPAPTLPSSLENTGFGRKLNPQAVTDSDAESGIQQNATGQSDTTQNLSPNSTFSTNATLYDLLEPTNSSTNEFSSPETFTRAHLLSSISDYNDDALIDSEFFTRTTFPYGSRFYPKTSVFYSNLNTPSVEKYSRTSKVWSPVYNTQWPEESVTSCSSTECRNADTLEGASTSLFPPLFSDDLVSPMFFRTDRELWVNNYKGNTYIDPSRVVTEVTRAKSRSQSSVSPKGESELDDITLLGYVPLDEDFGMRITKTKMHSTVQSSRTESFVNNLRPQRDRLSDANSEITADNTIPVELEKRTKDFENRQGGSELGSSYSDGISTNFNTNTEGTVFKTNKWTAVKAGEGNTLSEISIQLGNSSQGASTVTSDFFFPVAINETIEDLPNSLLLLHSADILYHPNMSLGNGVSKILFSVPTVSQGDVYDSFGVLEAFNSTSGITPTSIESTTGENKNEVKYPPGNISFADTNYHKNAIDYNKQDKILKSSEQSSYLHRNSDFIMYSSNPFQTTDSHDIFLDDSISEDQIPVYSGVYTSVPFLVTSSNYDSFFGDRIFSRPASSFDIASPAMISTLDASDDVFSPYLFSSFYDMSSSYDQLGPLSSFSETPFMFSSLLNSDYLLSSYWEREIPERTVLKESVLISSADTGIRFGSKILSTSEEPTPFILRSPTVDPFPMHDSSILFYVSSPHPHLVSPLPEKNRTDIPASTHRPPWDHTEPNHSDDYHEAPPPRITNPSCNTLPTCITMTIGMSWTEFCPVSDHLRKQLAESLSQLSNIIKPIHPHQLVLSSDHHQCKTHGQENDPMLSSRRRRRRRRRSENFVEIRIFVVDHDGEYDEKLTEFCGLYMQKWMPTAAAPFQNKIVDVRISHVGEETEEANNPESVPAESPTSTGIIAAITISTIAGACLFLLCILMVVMKQRLLQNRNCNPALDAYSLDSFSINASFRRRRVRQSMRSFLNHAFEDPELPSHPLNESGLVNSLKNTEMLEEEFKKLPMNMPKLEQIPSGTEIKNRYANVLPNPDTRVPLSVSTEDPLKEYINANYVKGYDGKHRAYVATQAPLPETVNDFWQMVWEQQSKVIIMVTLLEENGVPRCAAYFPESTLDCHKLYGDFQVSLQKKDIREFYTMSTFRLFHLEKNLFREVAHFWYTAWPATGVPSDPGYLMTFLLQARPFINTNSGPTVVHCSPGTGRTGVILALDMSMREFEQSRSVDLLRCIARIRKDRGGAVQTKEQYILLHEAIVEYASYIANQSHRPSIRSND